MPTQLKITDVEAAIIATLNAALANTQVQGLSSKDWDEQGNIIVIPPAVLVMFENGDDKTQNDITRLTYDSEYQFLLFCGAADLSSTDSERNSCYALLASVRAALAGKSLPLDSGASKTYPVALAGIAPEQFDSNGVWFSQRVRIGALAQFG